MIYREAARKIQVMPGVPNDLSTLRRISENYGKMSGRPPGQEERRSWISSLVRIDRGAALLSPSFRRSPFLRSTPKRALIFERSQLLIDRRGFCPLSRLSLRLSVVALRS